MNKMNFAINLMLVYMSTIKTASRKKVDDSTKFELVVSWQKYVKVKMPEIVALTGISEKAVMRLAVRTPERLYELANIRANAEFAKKVCCTMKSRSRRIYHERLSVLPHPPRFSR